MKIIVGLGNPEKKYERNLHNLGFIAADELAHELGVSFTDKKHLKAVGAETFLGCEKVVILKPLTYMNLSGEAVRAAVDYYKIDLNDLLVIYDDLDIAIGAIRFKPSGQSGTHNGLRNIVLHLGETGFPRIRIGTKPEGFMGDIIDYVLSDIPADKKDRYAFAVGRAVSCAKDFIRGVDFDRLMNVYNTAVSLGGDNSD